MEWRSTLESLSPSTINVRLSAVRKMVGEARRAGMIGQEEAASLTDIPNIRQKGTRLGNWLTREQAKDLLTVPDRSTLKGKRDYVILALLVGCALRRNELAELDVETIQLREGRWVMVDLEGKGRRIRTVAIPIWVKKGIDVWMAAAEVKDGRLLRSVSKSGKINRDTLSDWAIWSIVEHSSKQIGIEHFGAHDLRRTCANVWSAALSQAKSEETGGLRKCIRPLVECITPGQDGMRYALFLFNCSVFTDCLAHQARRASGSTVVPSHCSPADLAGNFVRSSSLGCRCGNLYAISKPDFRRASSAG